MPRRMRSESQPGPMGSGASLILPARYRLQYSTKEETGIIAEFLAILASTRATRRLSDAANQIPTLGVQGPKGPNEASRRPSLHRDGAVRVSAWRQSDVARVYSARSARIGSIEAARRAGR